MTFTAYYQLKNTKKDGLGVELLNSIAGTFVVLEECSYERPREIARFGHNGTAGDRSNAFSCAMNRARSLQNYSGAMCDYNVYEPARNWRSGYLFVLSSRLTWQSFIL